MKPSMGNPEYTVYVISGNTQYDVTPALISIDRAESKKEMAQSSTIKLANITSDGKRLSELFGDTARVRIHANDGSKNDEVFRGFIWTEVGNASIEDRTFTLKCFDNLIYMQEAEASEFFSSGTETKDIFTKVCGDWGIKLEYNYDSIVHSKMALRGSLSDILTTDVLDLVKERKGNDYTVLSEKDVMKVRRVGSNSVIYKILEAQNATSVSSERTKNGMVTKVVILGTADNDDREPVERIVSGDTSKYGTLQKIIRRDTNTTLTDAYEEGQSIIEKDGRPKWSYVVKAPDIPWIRKGDKVYVDAGDIRNQYLIVDDIDRTIDSVKNQMTLSLSNIPAPVAAVKVKKIIGEKESNPVFLRDLDSGYYIFEGYFAAKYTWKEPLTKIILFSTSRTKPDASYLYYDNYNDTNAKYGEYKVFVGSTDFLVKVKKEASKSYVDVYDNIKRQVWKNTIRDSEWSFYTSKGWDSEIAKLSDLPEDIKSTYLK